MDFPDDQRERESARRQPGDDGASVATPLEKQFSTIAGIDNMTSTQRARAHARSRSSSRLDRDIDAAAQDVQAAISQRAAQPAAGDSRRRRTRR